MSEATESIRITEKVFRAYFHCARKSYLLMFSRGLSKPTEYEIMLEQRKARIRADYLARCPPATINTSPLSFQKVPVALDDAGNIHLTAGLLTTESLIFKVAQGASSSEDALYEPLIFTTSQTVRQEDKLEITFAGYVLSKTQGAPPLKGKVVQLNAAETNVRLLDSATHILPVISIFEEWVHSRQAPPTTILNKHCPNCEFQQVCRPIAEKEDSLSQLARISEKELRRYEKKGIFTIKQLSFLYRPKKPNKRLKFRAATHKYELQALALRSGNIYIHGELVEIPHTDTEIFFDIEALPDRNFHYLFGLIVRTSGSSQTFQFWADCVEDELVIWNSFITLIEQYPACPIFHYGSFERKVIQLMGKKYGMQTETILDRLFNVNNCIFGKIYFPVRSNGLKDVCQFLGLSWSSPQASGLQSVVWRYWFDETGDTSYRQLLHTYNYEDCENLRCLVERLRDIAINGSHSPQIRFADVEGGSVTENAASIVEGFNRLLKSAHATYEQAKIKLKQKPKAAIPSLKKDVEKPTHNPDHRKIHKVIKVRRGMTCPNHPGRALKPRETEVARIITDLVFTDRGVKKVVTQYIGKVGYCTACSNQYNPPGIRRLGHGEKYGRRLKAWIVYQRMALQLPLTKITHLIEDIFSEKIASTQVHCLFEQLSREYESTEALLLKKILAGPVVHIDETSINILGSSQYVWVITDGTHVVFRHTEGREATIIHDLFDGYTGVICSDFYTGYDSVDCAQQKCWAHLIRDLNDDLRKSPFDAELEAFVSSVRDLIVPILEAVETYGLKTRNLRKFQKSVKKFYDQQIYDKTYRSDLMSTYQKRFSKYRDKLFVFLDRDGVPWNNNMAERALRHIAIQRKISGSFGKNGILQYLVLLGITQSCRFQYKSLLQFLLSGAMDVDQFKGRKDFVGWRMK
jgi:predicted RecB family nuclease